MRKNSRASEFLEVAKRAAYLGGQVVKDHFGKITYSDVKEKRKYDLVTFVDRLAEEVIKQEIQKKFKDHAFLAEESGRLGENREFLWIIDPLDGTTNFIHGYPVFSVSVALEIQGIIEVGVVYDPTRDELFWAQKGIGAMKNGISIKISARDSLANSFLGTGFPFRHKEVLSQYLETFRRIFLKATGIRRTGSAALDFAYIASGVFDGFFEYGLSPWDIAAGEILIKEAGGRVTDFCGGDKYLKTGNVVCGSSQIVKELVEIVQEVFGGIA